MKGEQRNRRVFRLIFAFFVAVCRVCGGVTRTVPSSRRELPNTVRQIPFQSRLLGPYFLIHLLRVFVLLRPAISPWQTKAAPHFLKNYLFNGYRRISAEVLFFGIPVAVGEQISPPCLFPSRDYGSPCNAGFLILTYHPPS